MPFVTVPPTRSRYLRLDKAPELIVEMPICGACDINVEHDGNGYVCPSCGTAWDSDPEHGQLAAEWSDEEAIETQVTKSEDAHLRSHEAIVQHKWEPSSTHH